MPLAEFQSVLGHRFSNPGLLQQALTHPSRSYDLRQSAGADNQRLEFLGDAVLQLIVTEHLYACHPHSPEGDLTARRARLVNRHQMHSLALRLGLPPLLVLGRGEETNAGRERPSNLADAVEAILGAIYLDAGYDAVRQVVRHHLLEQVIESEDAAAHANPKGALQERLQSRGEAPPVYHSVGEEGPAHARRYSVKVEWQGRELGRGSGASKREAEAGAAREALRQLESDRTGVENNPAQRGPQESSRPLTKTTS